MRQKFEEAEPWARDLWSPPPLDFVRVPHPEGDCFWAKIGDPDLYVIATARTEADGRRWMHVSCSRPNRLPTWADLLRVKEGFMGDRKAIQILPPKAEYVSLARFALHLWCCLDGDPLPDFRREGLI